MFFDLNIPDKTIASDPQRVLQQLRRLDYQCIAITTNSGSNMAKLQPCRTNVSKYSEIVKQQQPNGRSSVVLTSPEMLSQRMKSGISQFAIFTRLSILMDDNLAIHSSNAAVASYDLVSVQPTTERMFQTACHSLDIDIISIDMGSRLSFQLRPATINSAIQRGIWFEIRYSPALRDSDARRNLISNVTSLVRVTNGKNIIITSEASRAIELRAPYDVFNLASLFNMNQDVAKAAMSNNAYCVLIRAATRKRSYRGVVSLESIDKTDELPVELKWKVEDDFIAFQQDE